MSTTDSGPKFPTGTELMRRMRLEPDPWQIDVLESGHPRVLLNCCRQAGKSTAVAYLALAEALYNTRSLVLILSRSQRQSAELFRILRQYAALVVPKEYLKRLNDYEMELVHGTRIISLPCNEETIRGYSGVRLLVIDEAARVPDKLYRSVRPMIATVPGGRMVLLSTPCGKRGFFWDTWANGGPDWHRIEVPAAQVSRIDPTFLDEERRTLGESWFRQEYCCSFEALEGLVYPDFASHVVPGPAPIGKLFGGIDFGFANPFAAVWGVLDRDGVLWLTGEHYQRQRPLPYHAEQLPRKFVWYADPSGASDIEELRCAGFAIRPGVNDIRPGIAAVTARLETDRLKIIAGACPNLLREASLYRYSDERTDHRSETPLDEHNHALDALRYMISIIDYHQMARLKGKVGAGEAVTDEAAKAKKEKEKWLSYRNERLWTRLF
jgi:hypothetical protein